MKRITLARASLLLYFCVLSPILHAQGPPSKIGHLPLLSPHARPIVVHGDHVFVVNTAADTVDVIDTATRKITSRIDVGIDPVSIAVRPDGKEIWVSNHTSDSVSVIDSDPDSAYYLRVVATVQDIDLLSRSTRFDEPIGIAFASNEKAYVALSSQNEIAVINVASRKAHLWLRIRAQDPRAIVVRNNRLYVIPFESNNKTQLSGGNGPSSIDGKLVTYDARKTVDEVNVLSKGHVEDIIRHPEFPDRDLFIFDTQSDRLVKIVETLGTLLYGLAVDSKGNVYIAQTDARNHVNGKAGTKKHSLKEMGNRAFLNRITKVSVDGSRQFFDLESLPPRHPKPGSALATPFAIQVSNDDSTLFVSAASSDVLFSVDAKSGLVLDRIKVGAVPRGIALESDESGKTTKAWVFNGVANTVYLVDVADPANLQCKATIELVDPTPGPFKRGRIAFNTARASTTNTFSCASCHPDGHTDQLLWVLKTPVVTGGTQIQPRTTMPVRGLRDTAPYHWDGIPGDPYGGNNSANLYGYDKPNSDINRPESATRHVIDGSLASTMVMPGNREKNDEGKIGKLSRKERDALAHFILNIPYPPPQRRSYTNELSKIAELGFELFHVKGNYEGEPEPRVCGDCHRMPFFTSTNTPGENGMDAPTWRGAIDRFLVTPQGRGSVIDLPSFYHFSNAGFPEKNVWQGSWKGQNRFNPVLGLIEEASTGVSGAFARQVTLSRQTATDKLTEDMLNALECSAAEGGVVLQVEGLFHVEEKKVPMVLQFDAGFNGGRYVRTVGKRDAFSREKLMTMATAGDFVGTFTGRHGSGLNLPQPALWTLGSLHEQRGNQIFPRVHGTNKTMTISGRHISSKANIIVNGRRTGGQISVQKGDRLRITLSTLPSQRLNFLQIQNPSGLFSNDFIFFVESEADAIARRKGDPQGLKNSNLWSAIINDDLAEVKVAVGSGASLTKKNPQMRPPLPYAAFYGRTEIVEYLLSQGAPVGSAGDDGNTALHWAAFLGHPDVCRVLLKKGADPNGENKGGFTAKDMSLGWPDETAKALTEIQKTSWLPALNLDLEKAKNGRAEALKMLLATKIKDRLSRR